jgi:hypothetical protein
MLSQSHAVFFCRSRLRFQIAVFNSILHRPACPELRFQSLARSPTGWRLGWFNLWIQVQKETKPVDFTSSGASIDPCVKISCNLTFLKGQRSNLPET